MYETSKIHLQGFFRKPPLCHKYWLICTWLSPTEYRYFVYIYCSCIFYWHLNIVVKYSQLRFFLNIPMYTPPPIFFHKKIHCLRFIAVKCISYIYTILKLFHTYTPFWNYKIFTLALYIWWLWCITVSTLSRRFNCAHVA